jgi:hypothetical protein
MRLEKLKILLAAVVAAAVVLTSGAAELKEIVCQGSAEGEPAAAGEMALTNALREAVRQGAGVDILSETKVQNFKLEHDKVLTSSFGYVESHQVLEQKYDTQSKTYTLKIKAMVGKGTPGMDNVLALRLLVKRVGSPRTLIDCKEKIEGVKSSSPVGKAVLEEMAKKIGMEVLDSETLDEKNESEAARAEVLGDSKEAAAKRAKISSRCDIKITGAVTGEVGEIEETVPELKTRDVSIGFNLKAVWADSGETIATAKMPSASFQAKSPDPVNLPGQLARKYTARVMESEEESLKDKNAWKLFRAILAKWTTELDLGAKITVELKQADRQTLEKLAAELPKNPLVSYVQRREFDPKLYSSMEIETRLPAERLESEMLKILGPSWSVEQSGNRKIRLAAGAPQKNAKNK